MEGRDVVITGVGVISAAGCGWRACAERRVVHPTRIAGFDASGFPAQVAYQVDPLRPQPWMKRRKDLKLMSRDAQLALVAAGLAAEDAGVDPTHPGTWPIPTEDVALYMGVGLEPGDLTELGPALAASRRGGALSLDALGGTGIDLIPPLSALVTLPNMALAHVSINLELMGRGEALSPWGTAGFDAVAAAAESIARGYCEVALAGAADSDVDMNGLARYLRMGLLAHLRPDDVAVAAEGVEGLILGEGAAFFVLESRECAARRGRAPLARIARHVAHAVPTDVLGAWDGELERQVLAASLPRRGPVAVVGAAGHDRERRRSEQAAVTAAADRVGIEAQLWHPSSRVGWAAAASGMLDLADALATYRLHGPPLHAIVGVAWAPTGQLSTLVLDQLATAAGAAKVDPAGGAS